MQSSIKIRETGQDSKASNFNSLLAFMLEFVVSRAALECLAVLPCFTYFIAMIIVLLWGNK